MIPIILAAVAGALSATQTPELALLTDEMDRLVLAGQPIPPDFLLRVRDLQDPSDRMQAIIYLRRSGLLTGPALALEKYVFDSQGSDRPADRLDPVSRESDEKGGG